MSVDKAIDQEWQRFVAAKREAELAVIIEEENLRAQAAHAFVGSAFRDGELRTSGTAITKILPPVSRFAGGGGHVRRSSESSRSSACSSSGSSGCPERLMSRDLGQSRKMDGISFPGRLPECNRDRREP